MRKTKDCYQILGDYGYGWKVECDYATLEEAKTGLKEYRANCNAACYKIKRYKKSLTDKEYRAQGGRITYLHYMPNGMIYLPRTKKVYLKSDKGILKYALKNSSSIDNEIWVLDSSVFDELDGHTFSSKAMLEDFIIKHGRKIVTFRNGKAFDIDGNQIDKEGNIIKE